MRYLAIILSLLLVGGCATTGGLSSQAANSDSPTHIFGVHWAWWLLGVVAVGYALSESDSGNDDCDRYPYTREDGVRVLGSIHCIRF